MADSPGYSTLDDDVGVKFSRAWINCDYSIDAASSDEVFCHVRIVREEVKCV